ncbi:RNA polymerase sigma-70 factor (ECF subfamily) [Kribbella orskensis]|uniref:RNA polymerase sigma-70 factor (ECF subfamily) n=1 Tax=Kribbella orskensis TaxID=2512216 RepID=A0ABY2BAE0_9ACTN|nr:MULTISPECIES: sigma-70 family RNA polymerase sigma factor [Kribbella]TCN33410.1 RNA polymerase sigma-70 factor (ECF subfamily) [Kribbella sp. VKM Ac-2500]TCO13556.1 RNA polymerase sigma-70 factor (ECF subfamily) [Kribbella orskensis]
METAQIAVTSDDEEFARRIDPFRQELLSHCYRMLGSINDAEDLVQETYLRAWRSYGRFEGRSSLRVWLYRIATNVCLSALEHRSQRLLPSGLGAPSDDPERPLTIAPVETAWVQPLPGSPAEPPTDPAVIVAARDSVRLALIAALQHLPAKQRVVLILRDVLAWRAAEVADLLGNTTVAVNSLLQRARAQLERVAPTEDGQTDPTDPRVRALLDQYVSAFEGADITALMAVLRDDAALEMPPNLTWFSGRAAVVRFLEKNVFTGHAAIRMIRITANAQPAVATYWLDDGVYRPHALQVLTITSSGISRIVSFNDPQLFPTFDLPVTLAPEEHR